MRVGVVVFPGSNCDRDIVTVTRDILEEPTRLIWHQETNIDDIDLVVLPGGFSYGDYLRTGAIARFSPVMPEIVKAAKKGKKVLGICNGFQILTEVGLLPGVLMRNKNLHFICDRVPLRVEHSRSVWTEQYHTHQVITLPIAHGEGSYYGDPQTIDKLEKQGQILFRYSGINGEIDDAHNPNGSVNNIAGITNELGNVLGMMPHPERAADLILGGVEGKLLFESIFKTLIN
jgi:phosphoribosylformylglycinamidine synthase